jgi:hypothetical protein
LKWEGYGPEHNTWEPRAHVPKWAFDQWKEYQSRKKETKNASWHEAKEATREAALARQARQFTDAAPRKKKKKKRRSN